jgi:hypothetical protein
MSVISNPEIICFLFPHFPDHFQRLPRPPLHSTHDYIYEQHKYRHRPVIIIKTHKYLLHFCTAEPMINPSRYGQTDMVECVDAKVIFILSYLSSLAESTICV